MRFPCRFAVLGCVLLRASQLFGQSFDLSHRFQNPSGNGDDEFGIAVAAVGLDKVLIGAYADDIAAPNAGAAYLFSTTGELLLRIENPNPIADGGFGYDVATVGDKLLVGAWGNNEGADKVGAAYLFDQSGRLLQTFRKPNPNSEDRFGFKVAAVGDKVAVTAALDDERGLNAGAAYLFDQNGHLLATVHSPNAEALGNFGRSIAAIDDSHFVVGAYGEDHGALDAGAAYLFDVKGNLVQSFLDPDPESQDLFGIGSAGVGGRALIGANHDRVNGTDAGSVYLMTADGTASLRVPNPSPSSDEWFGYSLAPIGAEHFAVSAIWDGSDGSETGSVYLFDDNGTLLQRLSSPTGTSATGYGVSLASNEHLLFVGSPFDGGNPSGAGAVYMYVAAPEPPTYLTLALGGATLLLVSLGARQSQVNGGAHPRDVRASRFNPGAPSG